MIRFRKRCNFVAANFFASYRQISVFAWCRANKSAYCEKHISFRQFPTHIVFKSVTIYLPPIYFSFKRLTFKFIPFIQSMINCFHFLSWELSLRQFKNSTYSIINTWSDRYSEYMLALSTQRCLLSNSKKISFSSYGLKSRVTHNFLTHFWPFSVTSFSHLFSTGLTGLIWVVEDVSGRSFIFGLTTLGLMGFNHPALLLVLSGWCLFTQPTMQCRPSLGHFQPGTLLPWLSATHEVNFGKLHFEQQS